MARAKLAPILSNVFGSIGSDTFSHTRAYLVIKAKSYPGSKHPFTPSQLQINLRSYFAASIVSWKSLTPQQIEDWCNLASIITLHNHFAESYYQAGFNLYLELMQNRQTIGESIYTDAPTIPAIPAITTFTLTSHIPTGIAISIDFGAIGTDPTVTHKVDLTGSLNPGITYPRKYYRFVDTIPPSQSSPYQIQAPYVTKFGAPILDKKIYCKLIPIHTDTGFSSQEITASTIVIS
jgi:hypothetical protein